jgi:hypothetical protein
MPDLDCAYLARLARLALHIRDGMRSPRRLKQAPYQGKQGLLLRFPQATLWLSQALKATPLDKWTVSKGGAVSRKDIVSEGIVMDERVARLRTHQRNIDRYQNLLKTQLTATELQFVEKRLSEERFRIALLQFMSPPPAGINLHGARK